MRSLDGKQVHAVLWMTVIYFNMKTRKSDSQPKETMELFGKFLVNVEQKSFQERANFLRKQNKLG